MGALKSRLKVVDEKCSGCRICELMCSMIHHEGLFNPRWGLLRVEINRKPGMDTPLSMIDRPFVCAQCEPAPCAECCPEGAFERDQSTGIWRIRRDSCTGCGLCLEECPNHVIVIHDGRAMKCDLCGGEPVCVRFCPTGALIVD